MAQTTDIAIVTGTSAGIGAATAKLLLDAGWQVIGMSRRNVKLDNPGYHHVEADMSDIDELMAIAQRELAPMLDNRRWQRVGLVNNAADGGNAEFLESTEPASLQRMLNINTVAPVWLMGFVTRVAPATAALRIVNVSSGAAVRAFPGAGSYCASKAALRLASMAFAAELASPDRPGGPRQNAAVYSYSPGVVDTEMQTALREQDKPWTQIFADYHAKGMLAPPEAPAQEIVDFLAEASPEVFSERRLGDK